MPLSSRTKNWIGLICESLVSSGQLSTWEAAEYLNKNLFGETPNPYFLASLSPTEDIAFFLKGLYHPIVGAAFRDAGLPDDSSFHVFIDSTAMGNSTVLIIAFSITASPSLLSLDNIQPWNLRFSDVFVFHEWAQERYHEVYTACVAFIQGRDVEKDNLFSQRGAKKWERSHGDLHTAMKASPQFKRFTHHSGRSGS